jgi:hypothetical protein
MLHNEERCPAADSSGNGEGGFKDALPPGTKTAGSRFKIPFRGSTRRPQGADGETAGTRRAAFE